MKKQFKRRKIIGHIKVAAEQPRTFSPEWTAQEAKKALDYLAPLIRNQHIGPTEALVLAVGIMDRNITGKERGITEDEFQMGAHMILGLWNMGLFAPGPGYPYTLEQTKAAWDALPSDDEEDEVE